MPAEGATPSAPGSFGRQISAPGRQPGLYCLKSFQIISKSMFFDSNLKSSSFLIFAPVTGQNTRGKQARSYCIECLRLYQTLSAWVRRTHFLSKNACDRTPFVPPGATGVQKQKKGQSGARAGSLATWRCAALAKIPDKLRTGWLQKPLDRRLLLIDFSFYQLWGLLGFISGSKGSLQCGTHVLLLDLVGIWLKLNVL